MNKANLILSVSFLLLSFSYGQQKDTIYGKVKSIREKVIFLTERDNPKLNEIDNDYGHSGFIGPESRISQFKDIWYSTNFCY